MMNILTITLNPAFDLHYYIDTYRPYCESYAKGFEINVGGKGVNISRALLAENTESTAYVLVGRDNCEGYIASLQSEGIPSVPILIDGRIRENLTIHEEGKFETRISLDTFTASDKILDALYSEIKHSVDEDTIIAYSGRVPKGISPEKMIAFFRNLKALGARISLDSNTFTLEQIGQITPWLVKLNSQEADNLAPHSGHGDSRYALLYQLSEFGVSHIVISNGAEPALYSGEFDCELLPPVINAVSTIGSGDSLVAGFISAHARGESMESTLKNAIAYATASCLRPGTLPPLKKDIERLLPQVGLTFK